jgi:hypothetical protein
MGRRLVTATVFSCLVASTAAFAQDPIHLDAALQPRQEVPALSGFGSGTLEGELSGDLQSFTWTLTYSGVNSGVTQAHIHIGQTGVNGGIMVFFCSNLGNGPAGTPSCPTNGGTLSGTFTAANIIGPTAQGVEPNNFFEFQRALRQGVAYANVHSVQYPGGELRGQIKVNPDHQP